jgi:GGDEF domain-containing protein
VVRLTHYATPDTSVCRLKGDEFGLLRRHLANEDDVHAVADAVRVQLAEPFTIDHEQLVLDVCIGIAVYPQHGENFHIWLNMPTPRCSTRRRLHLA